MIKIIFIISKSFIICLIQEDIEMVVKDGKHKLVGFVDLGLGRCMMRLRNCQVL